MIDAPGQSITVVRHADPGPAGEAALSGGGSVNFTCAFAISGAG
jgi:hypothetical protein